MALLSLHDATLHLGKKAIFSNLDLRLGDGERIGLVGPNGSGKTSLLRLFAGQLDLDGGQLRLKKLAKVGYLPQDIALQGGRTLLAMVRDAVPGRAELDAAVAAAEAELQDRAGGGPDDEALLELSERVADLHERAAHFDTMYAPHVAERILAGLGFHPDDFARDLGELSGGWKMRAVLGALLFLQPDLLLMDEPTNHLDMPSVAWFSSFLRRYKRTFVLISHDREFLNEQVDRIVSFEPEGVRTYKGDYESYRRQRDEEAEVRKNRAKNLAKEREKAEEFITRFRYQATKAKAVQSRMKALERLDDVEVLTTHDRVDFRFPPSRPCSKQVLRTEGLAMAYGDLRVFSAVDLNVSRGEKIGVIGVNGAGKTTLLKILAGEVKAAAGAVDLGHHVEVGYYAQHHTDTLHPQSSIFEEVSRLVRDLSPTTIRGILGSMLFAGDDVDKPIAVLSGGERARVALAKLLLSPRNLLLMDEPTNHLDLESAERLAEALSAFDGTLIFVSHNKAFVRRLATRIWNVAGGKVETYPGTLDEYLSSALRQLDVAEGGGAPTRSAGAAGPGADAPDKPSRSKAADKERRRKDADARVKRRQLLGPLEDRIEHLEKRIAELERLQKERSDLLADPQVYADVARSTELTRAYQHDAHELSDATAEWESAATELEAGLAKLAEEE